MNRGLRGPLAVSGVGDDLSTPRPALNVKGAILGTLSGAAIGGLLGYSLKDWIEEEKAPQVGMVAGALACGTWSAADHPGQFIPSWAVVMMLIIPAGAIAGITAGFTE
jgi:hypothetical protein